MKWEFIHPMPDRKEKNVNFGALPSNMFLSSKELVSLSRYVAAQAGFAIKLELPDVDPAVGLSEDVV